jgi:CDP-glucose 4,6-dehydratase
VELPYKENYPLNSIYPYDVSKACADLICRSYSSKLFELPLIITRFTNIYGPGQLNFSALIPDLIRSVLLNKKFIPRGNGLSVRDFIYIDDIVHIYLALCKKLYQNKNISGQIFNAGTNMPIKIKDVIKKVLKIDKKKLSNTLQKLKKYKKTPKGEISHQFMESSKIQKYIKYKPLINLDQGIEKSFRWYSDYFFNK